MGEQRDLGQRLRAAKRERDDARNKVKLLVRQANEAKGVVREAGDRERNARAESIGGINNEMTYMRKELERDWDEAGTAGAALAFTNVDIQRLASELDWGRERSKGAKSNQRVTVNRAKAAAVRERSKSERIRDSLEDAEGQRNGIIAVIST